MRHNGTNDDPSDGLHYGRAINTPILQASILECGFQGIHAVLLCKFPFSLRDWKQPQQVDMSITGATHFQIGAECIRRRNKENVASAVIEPRLANRQSVPFAQRIISLSVRRPLQAVQERVASSRA